MGQRRKEGWGGVTSIWYDAISDEEEEGGGTKNLSALYVHGRRRRRSKRTDGESQVQFFHMQKAIFQGLCFGGGPKSKSQGGGRGGEAGTMHTQREAVNESIEGVGFALRLETAPQIFGTPLKVVSTYIDKIQLCMLVSKCRLQIQRERRLRKEDLRRGRISLFSSLFFPLYV